MDEQSGECRMLYKHTMVAVAVPSLPCSWLPSDSYAPVGQITLIDNIHKYLCEFT